MPYKDREKQKAYQRKWANAKGLEMRLKAIEILGGCCQACGETDFRVLQIDHIVPLRRQIYNLNGRSSIFDVVNGKIDLSTLQLLCANHHAIKTYDEDRPLFGKRLPI